MTVSVGLTECGVLEVRRPCGVEVYRGRKMIMWSWLSPTFVHFSGVDRMQVVRLAGQVLSPLNHLLVPDRWFFFSIKTTTTATTTTTRGA